jgi:hypothetical protein
MFRKNPNKTPTGFPLVFPAEIPERTMGIVNFDSRGDIPVRQFSRSDREEMRENLKRPAVDHLSRLIELKDALESCDPFRIAEAKKRLEEEESPEPKSVSELYRGENDPVDFLAEALRFIHEDCEAKGRTAWDLSPEEWIQYWERPDFSDLHRKLCFELSNYIIVNGTRLVFWRRERGEIAPAIYCDSLKMAYYVHTLIVSRDSVIGWRFCPRCHDLFLQSRVDQQYCSNAHGDAHRMARTRWVRKQPKAEEEMKRGKKDGTKKAR